MDSAGLERLRAEGVAVIDVRRPDEWRKTGVIEGSHLLTFFDKKGRYDLDRWLPALAAIVEADRPVALICRSGNRSGRVARLLDERFGYRHVYTAQDGILGWLEGGAPHGGAPVAAGARAPPNSVSRSAFLVATCEKAAICSASVTFRVAIRNDRGAADHEQSRHSSRTSPRRGKMSKAEAKRTVDLVLGEIEAGIKKSEEGKAATPSATSAPSPSSSARGARAATRRPARRSASGPPRPSASAPRPSFGGLLGLSSWGRAFQRARSSTLTPPSRITLSYNYVT